MVRHFPSKHVENIFRVRKGKVLGGGKIAPNVRTEPEAVPCTASGEVRA